MILTLVNYHRADIQTVDLFFDAAVVSISLSEISIRRFDGKLNFSGHLSLARLRKDTPSNCLDILKKLETTILNSEKFRVFFNSRYMGRRNQALPFDARWLIVTDNTNRIIGFAGSGFNYVEANTAEGKCELEFLVKLKEVKYVGTEWFVCPAEQE